MTKISLTEIFMTDKFDDKISVIDGNRQYTYKDLKELIAWETENIKNKKDNIVLFGEDNFSFIIQFFAAVFCNKNIWLLTERQRLNSLNVDYDLVEDTEFGKIENYKFKEPDIESGKINFFTSGSTGVPKNIRKSLYLHIVEAHITCDLFGLDKKDYIIAATTIMTHLFGITFQLFVPFFCGIKICTKKILYPDMLDIENCILISTPAFLNSVVKCESEFKIPPVKIFSAGSKLPEAVFDIFGNNSEIIDIYGSTETGNIAYKTGYNDTFKLFPTVKIKPLETTTEISSDYLFGNNVTVNDKLEEKDGKIFFLNRTDRLFKIYDKRVSADELEAKLNKNDFVENCYMMQNAGKLVCLCALSESGKKFLIENGILSLTKRLKAYLSEFSEIIPQKFKYIDRIPMTQTGKINKKLIAYIFNLNLSLPVILDRKYDETEVEYKIFFYRNCNFFNGHFPKYPVVPGVVQIFFAKELSNIYFDCDISQGQWRRIKFINIIKKDDIVNLKLVKDKNNVSFEYFNDDKKYSSGLFSCENVFKELV